MEVSNFARSLGITNVKVKRKAREYYRLSAVRLSCIGKIEMCRPVACIELAATLYGAEFDHDRAITLSGADSATYQSAITSLRSVLQIKSNLTFAQLAIKFGCVRLQPAAERILDTYKQRFTKALPESRRPHVTFTNTVFLAAAFWLAAKQTKLAISKEKLLKVTNSNITQFQKVVKSMIQLCFPKKKKILEAIANKNKDEAKQRSNGEKNNAKKVMPALEVKEDDLNSCLQVKPTDLDFEEQEYEEWKAESIAKGKEEMAEAVVKISTSKQASISTFFSK